MLTTKKDWLGLAVFLGLCAAVSAIGGLVTARSVETWYQTLTKPPFNPPDWVFGPVWTLLYIGMAVAAWNIWRIQAYRAATAPMALFALQLTTNLAWSLLFFGWRRPGWAFVDILMLIAAVFSTLVSFWRVSPLSGALFLPYLAWIGFAAVLNFHIWRLNP